MPISPAVSSEPDNVTLSVLVGKVGRLNRRCRLLERQVEILCDVMFSLITVERSRGLLEQVRFLSEESSENRREEESYDRV
jgi:hypothetical protein